MHPYLAAASHVHLTLSGNLVAALIVLGAMFLLGRHFGRKRGLRHLGEVELRNRWASVRGHKRW